MQVLRAYRYKLELKPEQEEILGREESCSSGLNLPWKEIWRELT